MRNRVEIKSVTKRKKLKKQKNDKILAFCHRSKMTVTWLVANF